MVVEYTDSFSAEEQNNPILTSLPVAGDSP